jgi:hypothetical protein
VSAVACKALREGLTDAPRGTRNNSDFVVMRFRHWTDTFSVLLWDSGQSHAATETI